MAFSLRALAGAVVVLTACGSPTFKASGDGGDGATTDAALEDGGVDAADAASAGGLVCPGALPSGTCELKNVCCMYKLNGGNNNYQGTCGTAGKCSGPAPPGSSGDPPGQLVCTRSAQCNNLQVCCIVRSGGGGGGTSTSSCAPLATCSATGAVLCEMGRPTSSCPGGLAACATSSNGEWGLPAELGTCGGSPPK